MGPNRSTQTMPQASKFRLCYFGWEQPIFLVCMIPLGHLTYFTNVCQHLQSIPFRLLPLFYQKLSPVYFVTHRPLIQFNCVGTFRMALMQTPMVHFFTLLRLLFICCFHLLFNRNHSQWSRIKVSVAIFRQDSSHLGIRYWNWFCFPNIYD
jgi:hypothetical protein